MLIIRPSMFLSLYAILSGLIRARISRVQSPLPGSCSATGPEFDPPPSLSLSNTGVVMVNPFTRRLFICALRWCRSVCFSVSFALYFKSLIYGNGYYHGCNLMVVATPRAECLRSGDSNVGSNWTSSIHHHNIVSFSSSPSFGRRLELLLDNSGRIVSSSSSSLVTFKAI